MHRCLIAASSCLLAAACAGSGDSAVLVPSATTVMPSSSPVALPPTTAPAATNSPTTSAPSAAVLAWTRDMEALADGVRRIHPNPFWRQPEAEFDDALDKAPSYLATLGRDDARAEVMRLVAQLDGHSGVYPFEVGFHLYAVHLYKFGEGIYIVNAPEPDLIGARLMSIGGMPTQDAIAAVTPYGARDNESTVDVVVPMLLATPEVLHAAGVIDDPAAPHMRIQLIDGSERTIDPEALTWDEFTSRIDPTPVGLPKRASIPALARRDEPFWLAPLADGTVMYMQYNEVVATSGSTTMEEIADEIEVALDAGVTRRVVIDLRNNPGGDKNTYRTLVNLLTRHPALAEPNALVVIIGRQTFSAGMTFATELDQRTGAVFVGEPTGGRPNLYADVRPVLLPNSGITVQISSRYLPVGGPDDEREWIAPEFPAAMTIDDFLADRDPVLEAALALP